MITKVELYPHGIIIHRNSPPGSWTAIPRANVVQLSHNPHEDEDEATVLVYDTASVGKTAIRGIMPFAPGTERYVTALREWIMGNWVPTSVLD